MILPPRVNDKRRERLEKSPPHLVAFFLSFIPAPNSLQCTNWCSKGNRKLCLYITSTAATSPEGDSPAGSLLPSA